METLIAQRQGRKEREGIVTPVSKVRSRLQPAHALVLLALLVGLALRFVSLSDIPPPLHQDEAVNAYDAYSLALTGRDHHGHLLPFPALESFGDWVSPLLTYLTVPAVGVLGLHLWVVRAVPAVLGAAAIPLAYLLGTTLFGRRSIGVLAAWAIALLPWHAHLSRWAIPPAVVPTMILLTLYLFVSAISQRSERRMVFAALAAGLTMLAYPTMKLYIPLLGLAMLVIFRRQILGFRRATLVWAALVVVVLAGPTLYFSIADPGGRARFEFVSLFQSEENITANLLAQQYLAYFSPEFLFVSGDGNARHSQVGYGVLLWSTLPFLLVGLLWLGYTAVRSSNARERQSAQLVLAALLLYPVPGSLTVPNPQALRAVHLIPLVAILAAAGAQRIGQMANNLFRPTRRRFRIALLVAIGIVAGVVIGVELVDRYRDYFQAYPVHQAWAFQYGLDQALAYAREHEAEYQEIWVTDTTQPYIYVLFYSDWSPKDTQHDLNMDQLAPGFAWVEQYGKYRFPVPGDVRGYPFTVLFTVLRPDGNPAYEVRLAEPPGHGRVLWIGRPVQ
jgi:4-amino-4-deoxy-L-arabinose transferase-like glycosyltransferase